MARETFGDLAHVQSMCSRCAALILSFASLNLWWPVRLDGRIGAATSGADQGFSSTSLQQLGLWSSSAHTSYIRPDIDAVLPNQRSLKP